MCDKAKSDGKLSVLPGLMFIFKPRSAPNDRFRLPKPMNGHKLGDKIEAISPNTLNVIGAISPNKNGKVRVRVRVRVRA